MPRSSRGDSIAWKTEAIALARTLSEKKGEAVVILDIRKESPLADFLLVATVLSRPHMRTLEAALDEKAGSLGLRPLHRSRPASDRWQVLDFGSIIVHLMSEEARGFYAVEKLYPGSKRLRWEPRNIGGREKRDVLKRTSAALRLPSSTL